MRLIALLAILALSLASVSAFATERVGNIEISFTQTSVTANWDGNSDSYVVRLVGGGEDIIRNVSTNHFTQDDLRPGVWYNLIIKADGTETESNQTFRTTKSLFQSTLQAIPETEKINLTWADSNNKYDDYRVRVSPAGNDTNITDIIVEEHSYTVTDLTPDMTYRVRVQPVYNTPENPNDLITRASYWDRAELYVKTQSGDTIQNLQATTITLDSITITWDSFPGTLGYTVRVTADKTIEDTITETTHTINDLTPGIAYVIEVIPDDSTDSKDVINVRTLPVVEELDVEPDQNTLNITWKDTYNDFEKYEIRLTSEGDSPITVKDITDTEYTWSGLDYETRYTVYVIPDDLEAQQAIESATTGVPPKLQGLSITPDYYSLAITWDDYPGDDNTYKVRVFPVGDASPEGDPVNTNSFDKFDLVPNTEYTVVVVPDNLEDAKDTKIVSTLELPKLQNLNVVPSQHSLAITWNDYPGDDNKYKVRVFIPGSPTPGEEINSTEYTKTDLVPNTEYRVVVTPDDLRDKRSAANVWTLEELSKVENLFAIPNVDNAVLSWNTVDDATTYTVSVIDGSQSIFEGTTTETSITIPDLSSGTSYIAKVMVTDHSYTLSEYSFTTNYAAPENFDVNVDYEDSKILFKWDESNDADSYIVEQQTDELWNEVTTSTSETASIPLDDDDYGNTLLFRILAVHDNSKSVPSTSKSITIQDRQFATITDGFENLDNWTVIKINDTITPGWSSAYAVVIHRGDGQPPPSAHIDGEGYATETFLTRTIDLSDLDNGDDLYISIDYHVFSGTPLSTVTNARLTVTTIDDRELYTNRLVNGGVYNTGWQTFTKNINGEVENVDGIIIKLSMVDSWARYWNQEALFDNFYIGTNSPPLSSATGASGTSSPPLNEAQRLSQMILDGETNFEGFDADLVSQMLQNYNMTGGQN